jgi:uncharacterized low-complexity protein
MKKLLIVAAIIGAFLLGNSAPAQYAGVNMRNAREALLSARASLEKATNIPFGRREKALDHVNKAIEQCNLAIERR